MSQKKPSDPIYSQWYLRRGKAVRGPFPSITIRRLIAHKKVLVSDEISKNQQDWRPVGLVPEVLPPNIRNQANMGIDEVYDDYQGTPGDLPLPFEEKTRFPLIPILVGIAITGVIVGGTFLLDRNLSNDTPDCRAAPAPNINWNNCLLGAIEANASNLHHLRASNSDLQGAKFSSSNLSGAVLQYSNLSNSDLSYGNLTGSHLKGSNLRNADLSYADLTAADLSFANLRGANLGSAKLERATLDNAVWLDGSQCGPGSLGRCLPQPQPTAKPATN